MTNRSEPEQPCWRDVSLHSCMGRNRCYMHWAVTINISEMQYCNLVSSDITSNCNKYIYLTQPCGLGLTYVLIWKTAVVQCTLSVPLQVEQSECPFAFSCERWCSYPFCLLAAKTACREQCKLNTLPCLHLTRQCLCLWACALSNCYTRPTVQFLFLRQQTWLDQGFSVYSECSP